ncbi:unnamed protein product [Vicia faba]|uniref:Uncharacterized protein n=1 Tax=Vicia faba TaxID=3906 RepID=A0AAV0YG56_VICFA|nr:unnamed protein product [Vicia faba]
MISMKEIAWTSLPNTMENLSCYHLRHKFQSWNQPAANAKKGCPPIDLYWDCPFNGNCYETGVSMSDTSQVSPAPLLWSVGASKGHLSMADIERMGTTSQDVLAHDNFQSPGKQTRSFCYVSDLKAKTLHKDIMKNWMWISREIESINEDHWIIGSLRGDQDSIHYMFREALKAVFDMDFGDVDFSKLNMGGGDDSLGFDTASDDDDDESDSEEEDTKEASSGIALDAKDTVNSNANEAPDTKA